RLSPPLTFRSAELIREEVVYLRFGHKLKRATRQLKSGMTKEQVIQVFDRPEGGFAQEYAGGPTIEYCYWNAGYHQGGLWKLLGLTWEKGHYDLIAFFDREEKL